MTPGAALTVRVVAWDDPASVLLRGAQRAEIEARYAGVDAEPGAVPSADDVPIFVVAFDGDDPVACGGLRPIDAEHGEIKRMYVAPDRRGTGAARLVLAALEAAARDAGWTRLVLETGRRQPDAVRFYTREGYAAIPQYGDYVGVDDSLCFGKQLVTT